jgi:hypothetical protein
MRINQIMLVGIALIILGVVAFAYQGITYTRSAGRVMIPFRIVQN